MICGGQGHAFCFEDIVTALQLSGNAPTFTVSCPGFQWEPLGLNPTILGHLCSDTDLLSFLTSASHLGPLCPQETLAMFGGIFNGPD